MPEHGWFGCDPTLGEETSQRHIVSGVSSHPRGVMPISGAYSGPTSSFLGMTVSVKIAPCESQATDQSAVATGFDVESEQR
jgi:transglutaminase-like putative cysteine protease